MADVVHTEGGGGGNNIVAIVAIVLLAGVAILFVMYVLPTMRKPEAAQPEGGSIEINLPAPSPEPSPEPAPEPAQ